MQVPPASIRIKVPSRASTHTHAVDELVVQERPQNHVAIVAPRDLHAPKGEEEA